jgi:hypothetical protein
LTTIPRRRRQAAATTQATQTASTGQKHSRFSVYRVQANAAGVARLTASSRMAITTMRLCGSTTKLTGAAGVQGTEDHHDQERPSSDHNHETESRPSQWRGLCGRCRTAICSHAHTHAANAAPASAQCWTMRTGFLAMNHGCKTMTMYASTAHGMRRPRLLLLTQARPMMSGTHNRHPDAEESVEAVATTKPAQNSTALASR